jgi:hypothetical protein
MTDPYVIATWVCCVMAVTGFAVYSVVFTYLEKRKAAAEGKAGFSAEEFVTARGSANLSQIAWSFYASSVGAWVIVTPASYAALSGWVGMLMYAIACGIPVIAIAHFGKCFSSAALNGCFDGNLATAMCDGAEGGESTHCAYLGTGAPALVSSLVGCVMVVDVNRESSD